MRFYDDHEIIPLNEHSIRYIKEKLFPVFSKTAGNVSYIENWILPSLETYQSLTGKRARWICQNCRYWKQEPPHELLDCELPPVKANPEARKLEQVLAAQKAAGEDAIFNSVVEAPKPTRTTNDILAEGVAALKEIAAALNAKRN
jgi:hypothetical protein